MAEDEQFSLCWNNFNSNLSAGFHESLCRGDLVDVTLAAEGQLVKAHRLVLSVCSPYFRNMFNQMPANQHAFVFLKDVSHSALKDLIQFMYCGEVNVKQDALATFISTAEALQIKGLTESGETAAPSSPSKTVQVSNTISTSPRVRQQPRTISRTAVYKLESEDSSDDKPIAQKRSQRVIASSSGLKRLKTEPAESTIIGTVDTKGDGDFIELPIEIPTKSETEYADDTEEVEGGEQETTYVEDETYGDMKYDETYFTENDETGKAGMSGFSETYEGDTTTEGQGYDIKILKSPWHTLCLVVNDYIYNCHSRRGNKVYWRCHNYSKKQVDLRCRARCVLVNGRITAMTGGKHNHMPHTAKINKIIQSQANQSSDEISTVKLGLFDEDEYMQN